MENSTWNPGPPKLGKIVGCRVSKHEHMAFSRLVEQLGQTKSEFLRSLLVAALAANATSTDQAISTEKSVVTEP